MIDMLHWVGTAPIEEIEEALPLFLTALAAGVAHLILMIRVGVHYTGPR